MAWDHDSGKSARKVAARLVSEASSMLSLINSNEKKSPAYVSGLLGVEVSMILYNANSEISNEIGDGMMRTDLGFKDKVGRKKALQDVAYFVKKELKAVGVNTRLLDNRASKNAVKDYAQMMEESGDDSIEIARVRNLTNGLHGMTNSDRKLTDIEKTLGGFASASTDASALGAMSDEELSSKGYYRVPAFTRSDGTKVKSHIRKMRIA